LIVGQGYQCLPDLEAKALAEKQMKEAMDMAQGKCVLS